MKLIDRINWIKGFMAEPAVLVKGEEFNEVERAVRTSTPMQPYHDGVSWRCVCCGTAVEYYARVPGGVEAEVRDDFCSGCGQAVDWSDEDNG